MPAGQSKNNFARCSLLTLTSPSLLQLPILRPKLPCLFLLLISGMAHWAIAQVPTKEALIKGRVVDAKTRLPIPFASLQLRTDRTGTTTNTKGHFSTSAPQKLVTDTLLVEALGYQSRPIAVQARVLADSIILLQKLDSKPEPSGLIPGTGKAVALGSKKKKPDEGMIQGLPGTQYALLMHPPANKKLGIIRNVSFYIGENGFPKDPFRVRIYRANGPGHSPGTNLLTASVIIHSTAGGQWFTVNLSAYGIDTTNEDFFVAMEWLMNKGWDFYNTNFMDCYTPYGQIMRPTFEFKESLTWNFTIGKGWTLLTLANNKGRRYNAMIKAEVETFR